MARFSIYALLALASYATARSSSSSLSQSSEPCAQMSQEIRLGTYRLPATTAYACLTSVPFDKKIGAAVVDNFRKWTLLHSALTDLKNPGIGYEPPSVDLLADIDALSEKVSAGYYKNHYAFESDLASVSFKAYDGHYAFKGPVFSHFRWIRGNMPDIDNPFDTYEGALISVSPSKTGAKVPEVYFHSSLFKKNEASPIVKINGVDTIKYLEKEMEHQTFQDPDTRWNTLFAREQSDSPGAWIQPFTYPGSNFTAEFKNGTSKTVETWCQLVNDANKALWGDVVDGKSFYSAFVDPSNAVAPVAVDKRSINTGTETFLAAPTSTLRVNRSHGKKLVKRTMPKNYPAPLIEHDTQQIGAYFLDDAKLSDIAVLAFNTFSSDDAREVLEFQSLVERFISHAKKQGKSKMIIDVSSNGGGSLFLGYDIFKHFFPTIEPDIGSRMPATEAINIVGKQFGTITIEDAVGDGTTSAFKGQTDDTLTPADAWMSVIHYTTNVDEDQMAFKSWKEMAGPVTLNGGEFTNILRYNLSYEYNAHGGLKDITGYGTRKNIPASQPFKAEDIILVHDGYCASTCAIFTDLMRRQGGVRSIALGGRPQTGPMQSVGGTKGSMLLEWWTWSSWARAVLTYFGTAKEKTEWAKVLPTDWAINMNDNPPTVNARNAYHPGSGTPLQFLNETADCRLWYTPAMLENVTSIWETVAHVAWNIKGGTGQKCVPGSETDGKPVGNVDIADAKEVKTGQKTVEADGGEKGEAVVEGVDSSAVEGAAFGGRVVNFLGLAGAVVVAGAFAL